MRANLRSLDHVGCGRSLYLVPDRVVERVRYAPARTLHLLDIENLMCGPIADREVIAAALAAYRAVVPVAPADHVVVAANPRIIVEVGLAIPSARLLVGLGKDGADLALLDAIADVVWVAQRYDRVILGSGDGIFLDALVALRELGIAVGVVGVPGRVALGLRHTAHMLRYIGPGAWAPVAA